MSSLSELTEQLLVHVRKLDTYTTANKIPSASFETDVFQDLPAELQESRSAAVEISQTIRKLTLGPEGITTDILFSVSLSNRKLATIFPQVKVSRRQTSLLYVSSICTKSLKRSQIPAQPRMKRFLMRPVCRNPCFTAFYANQW